MTEAEHKALQDFIELSTLPNGTCLAPTARNIAKENKANGTVVQNGVKPTEGQLALANPQKTQTVVTLDKTDAWPFGTIFEAASPEVKITRAPSYLLGKPIHDFDASSRQNIPSKETYLVLCRRAENDRVFRFNQAKSLYLLGPLHPIRLFSVKLLTNQYFEFFVILIILINCIFLALDHPPEEAEYIFAAIYTVEMFLKIISRGFILHSYAYLRDAWNWLDFVVVILGYITLSPNIANFSGIRTIRVLRALRTISALKGLKAMVNTLLRSLKMLKDVLVLFMFFLCVMALIGLQLFVGVLRQKCVRNSPLNGSAWNHAQDEDFWYYENGAAIVCGNYSSARSCPANYTCMKNAGPNPDHGYTNFDNIIWALIMSFQLLTMDFWENIFNKIMAAAGSWYVIYFLAAIFFCSFYLLNLVLAVVALSYEQEMKLVHREEEQRKREKKTAVSYPADQTTLQHLHPLDTSLSVSINTIHAVRAQRKVEAASKNQPKVAKTSWYHLIARKSSFKEVLELKLEKDPFDHNMTLFRRFQKVLCTAMGHPAMELIINCFILGNTVVLALYHNDMDPEFERVLDVANLVFTVIFFVEMVLKLVAVSLFYYMQSRWNMFDGLIVVISFVDTGMELMSFRESSGTSIFRTFRLVRILKLAQSWKTMGKLLSTIANSVGPIGNITLILGLVIYIFAVMGVKVYGKSYTPEAFGDDGVPRWNFLDFRHSFMMVFRILCGEWIEPLWDCMRATSPAAAIPFFLLAFIIGNFIVLNLFLALLLNAFDSGEDSDDEDGGDDDNDEDEESTLKLIARKLTTTKKNNVFETAANDNSTFYKMQNLQKRRRRRRRRRRRASRKWTKHIRERGWSLLKMIVCFLPNAIFGEGTYKENAEVDDCFPECFMAPFSRFTCPSKFRCWLILRWRIRCLVEHKYFDWFILFMVLISSLVLAFEDVHLSEKPALEKALNDLNYFFAAIFTLEFLLKVVGLGAVSYFSSFWNCLDCFIVIISLVCVIEDGELAVFRSLRTVRALRPLRAVSRLEGMKIVVNALFAAIPGIINVLLVSLLFWLIFSILGVQLFAGLFYKCVDQEGSLLPATVVPNKTECLKHPEIYRWVNSNVNFDNVMNGFLALFQVATFEGWMELMVDAVDATTVDSQPVEQNNFGAYIFFVIFIVIGSFFVLNLFVGVIIDNFNSLKRKYDELNCMGMLLTETQRQWVRVLQEAAKKKPMSKSIRPTDYICGLIFDMVTSTTFEIGILGVIMLNMGIMMFQHYEQEDYYTFTLPRSFAGLTQVFNWIFTGIFAIEAALKLLALRIHYFKRFWNVFDFIVLILSLVGIVIDELNKDGNLMNSGLLRVMRVFRIARLMRVLQFAKGVRQLLLALIVSLPALINVGTLLFLVIFIYASIGMSIFGHVKKQGNIDEVVNFETFGNSMMLLFRLATGAGWNDVFESLMVEPPDCDPEYKGLPNGNCGSKISATFYLVSYIFIVFLIIINMYIAIILENVNRAQEANLLVKEDDFYQYYSNWTSFVPEGKQFIPVRAVPGFVAQLNEPFRIERPNEEELSKMLIPVRMRDRVHCFDLLRALVKRLLTKHGESFEAFEQIAMKMEDEFKNHFRRKAGLSERKRKLAKVTDAIRNRRPSRHEEEVSPLRDDIEKIYVDASIYQEIQELKPEVSTDVSANSKSDGPPSRQRIRDRVLYLPAFIDGNESDGDSV